MIRKPSLLFVLTAILAVSIAGVPLLAEADLFIKRGEKASKSEGSSKKRGIYIPRKQPGEAPNPNKSRVFFKPSTLKVVKHFDTKQLGIQEADPTLISTLGPGPSSAEELTQIAQAYRQPKILAMLQQQKFDNQNAVKAQLAVEQKIQMAAAREAREAAKKQSASKKSAYKKKLPTYKGKSKSSISKPKRVFNRMN